MDFWFKRTRIIQYFSHTVSLKHTNFLPLGFPLSKNKVEIHQHCLRVSSNICGFGVITFDQETLSGPLHKYTSSRSEGLSPSLSTSTLAEK